MQRLAQARGGSGTALEGVTIDHVAAFLDAPMVPDADLLIRTSGEMRISNFLLWQAAYAELVFLPVLWPEFGRSDLEAAVVEFGRRDRRFGAVSAAVAS
jgi:undecaprenyl diphosphate synthase